ncbi:MAG: hypothetical protein ACUVV5_12810 [Candidatus Aminicenantales bacterium]
MEAPVHELDAGTVFAGRYQIIEEMDKGRMGKVYKALDMEIQEKAALKLIKPEIAVATEIVERFRNELKFAHQIRHKNVCQMFVRLGQSRKQLPHHYGIRSGQELEEIDPEKWGP